MKLKRSMIERYFTFCNARHAIYLARQEGKKWPWTEDEVLKTYKFTNIYRELDTGTVWYRKNIVEMYGNSTELFFNTAWYRQFNYWPTAQRILHEFDGIITKWDAKKLDGLLRKMKANGEKIFTSAHMITGTLGGDKIHQAVDMVCTPLWNARHELEPKPGDTLQQAFERFKNPGFGPFIRYEVITDLRHTRYLKNATDIMTWANPGPGCKRGIMRLAGYRPYTAKFGHSDELPNVTNEDLLEIMQFLLDKSPEYLASFMMPFEMRDIEHSLCEFDKYMRATLGEGKPRQRYVPPSER